jgi:hypothetical protein
MKKTQEQRLMEKSKFNVHICHDNRLQKTLKKKQQDFMIAETFHLESILSIRSGVADVQEPAFQYYLSI